MDFPSANQVECKSFVDFDLNHVLSSFKLERLSGKFFRLHFFKIRLLMSTVTYRSSIYKPTCAVRVRVKLEHRPPGQILFIYFIHLAFPCWARDTATGFPSYSWPFVVEEVTVHNTGICLLLSTSMWVLLSPPIERREIRPTA